MSRRRGRSHGRRTDWSLFLKIGAAIAVLSIIFGALFLSGFLETDGQCKKAGYSGASGMDTCKVDQKYVYDRIAIVAGNTANSPAPRLSDELIKYLKNSLLNNSDTKIHLYSATPSHPKLTFEKVEFSENGDNQQLLDDIDVQVDNINNAINVSPTENGAEYLGAIQAAADSIQKDDHKSIVLVIGSGLSDAAPLNFAKDNLLSKTPGDLLKAYQASRPKNVTYPSYDVDLVWYGIGKVAKPQSNLNDYISTLKDHYSTILESMDIDIKYDDDSMDGDSVDTKHAVKVTPVETTELFFELDDAVVSFKPGTAEFRDGEVKVWQAIEDKGIPSQLTANPNKNLQISGYVIAVCGKSADKELALKRANAVKALLQKHNITNAMTTVGVGETNEAKASNLCIDAKGNPVNGSAEQIQKQRKVVIS